MASTSPWQILNPAFSNSAKGHIRKGMGGRKVASWRGALCIRHQRVQSLGRMNTHDLFFQIGFWHPFGPHAGETTEEIISRKRDEIRNNGWTLWSFQFRHTLGIWYQEIVKVNPERVLVFCSEGRGAKDPKSAPRQCNYFLPIGESTPKNIPPSIQIPHPLGTRTKGSAFIVKEIVSPIEYKEVPIEWFKGGQWQTTQLPTRPEYLIKPGNGYPMRRYGAVLELQQPFLAEIGV